MSIVFAYGGNFETILQSSEHSVYLLMNLTLPPFLSFFIMSVFFIIHKMISIAQKNWWTKTKDLEKKKKKKHRKWIDLNCSFIDESFCCVFVLKCLFSIVNASHSKRDACLFPCYRRARSPIHAAWYHFFQLIVVERACDTKKNLGSYLIMNMAYIFCHLEPTVHHSHSHLNRDSPISHKISANFREKNRTHCCLAISHTILHFLRDGQECCLNTA